MARAPTRASVSLGTLVGALALGFFLLRGLGQGALGLVSLHAINVWFVRRPGLAVGIPTLWLLAPIPLALALACAIALRPPRTPPAAA